jgi:hypothetical protein
MARKEEAKKRQQLEDEQKKLLEESKWVAKGVEGQNQFEYFLKH